MLEVYDSDRLSAAQTNEIGDALERGNIIKFSPCPIELPPEDDLRALRDTLPRQLKRKNVSYHPEADRVTGLDDQSPIRELAHGTLERHRSRVTAFLRRVMPGLANNLRAGTCSFRPLEERGRNLKAHASNELVHIDAGAYGATNGDRILRFFVNVNPEVDRIWKSKGAFPDLFARHRSAAGLDRLGRSLERGTLGRFRSAALHGLARAGVPLAPMLDSSPYDRAMRKFHNFMKDTPSFQEASDADRIIHFEPYTAWMVLTDMVSHASYSGQHALVYTGIIPLADCRLPEMAPYNILLSAA